MQVVIGLGLWLGRGLRQSWIRWVKLRVLKGKRPALHSCLCYTSCALRLLLRPSSWSLA